MKRSLSHSHESSSFGIQQVSEKEKRDDASYLPAYPPMYTYKRARKKAHTNTKKAIEANNEPHTEHVSSNSKNIQQALSLLEESSDKVTVT